ncbi:MAG: hypothetical protein IIA67_03960, partial [Planctomycetes bacterium]|nr:hypothetical protein [Planctomycetota bacterium]
MTDEFDPYHSWLGIPPRHQPPNHYRLLGVQAFESDIDVIENAAGRQMGHVRTYQTGQHSALSQRILNEIAKAKVCLLNPQKKAGYDQQLRVQQQSRLAPKKPHIAQAKPLPVASSPSVEAAPSIITDAASAPAARTSGLRSTGSPARGRPAKPAWKSPLLIAGACGAVTVLLIAVVAVSVQMAPKEKQEVAKRDTGSGDAAASRSGGSGQSNVPPGERGTQAGLGRAETDDANPLDPIEPEEAVKKSGEQQVDDGNNTIEVDPPQENKQNPVSPFVAVIAKRMPIPDADAVAAAKTEISELFELSKKKTRADKARVANDLAGAAVDEATNTPEHFAILSICRELAASAGALDTAMLAIKRLDAVYVIDAWQMRLSTMQSVARTISKSDPAAVDQIVMQCSEQIEAAARDDRYDIATSL